VRRGEDADDDDGGGGGWRLQQRPAARSDVSFDKGLLGLLGLGTLIYLGLRNLGAAGNNIAAAVRDGAAAGNNIAAAGNNIAAAGNNIAAAGNNIAAAVRDGATMCAAAGHSIAEAGRDMVTSVDVIRCASAARSACVHGARAVLTELVRHWMTASSASA
jgi:hypothetical protein